MTTTQRCRFIRLSEDNDDDEVCIRIDLIESLRYLPEINGTRIQLTTGRWHDVSALPKTILEILTEIP